MIKTDVKGFNYTASRMLDGRIINTRFMIDMYKGHFFGGLTPVHEPKPVKPKIRMPEQLTFKFEYN